MKNLSIHFTSLTWFISSQMGIFDHFVDNFFLKAYWAKLLRNS